MSLWSNFHVALSFLTPWGRAHEVSENEIQNSLVMYPMVGWFLGSILVLVGHLPLSSWVLVWMVIGTQVLTTRGLHWDGWADLWDAWGSGAQGEKFWKILKDSHIGAFGVLGLILAWGLLVSLYASVLSQKAWLVLAWSCAVGRLTCLGLAYLSPTLARPGLGQTVIQGSKTRTIIFAVLITWCPVFILPIKHLALTALLMLSSIFILRQLGRKHQGLNGDFFGAAIISGELAALLPLALTL